MNSRLRLSLGGKLATATIAVLLVVSTALFLHLSARERTALVSAKQHEADTIADLVANETAAAIDFGDAEDVRRGIESIRRNGEVLRVTVVRAGDDVAIAAWDRGAPGGETVRAGRPVLDHGGAVIARVEIEMTLAREERAYVATRWRILFLSMGLAGVTAGLLLAIARWQISAPLVRLADAARRLADGEHGVRAEVKSQDELGELAVAFNRMGEAVAFRQERLQKEMELAQRIQASILPRVLAVDGLELSAQMIPATEVGGDYYDVLPVADGCWFGIGDVAGHGLNAGLIMMMIQCSVASLVRRDPDGSPQATLSALNDVLCDNIRDRLRQDDHATLTLLRYDRRGRVVFAGAHEDIVVLRAEAPNAELVETPGPWVGAMRGIGHVAVESTLELAPGDLFMLHTDGLTEARNAHHEMFGIERLMAALEARRNHSVGDIREGIVAEVRAWAPSIDDDLTLLVARYVGGAV